MSSPNGRTWWPYGWGGGIAFLVVVILLVALIFFPAKLTSVFLAWCIVALCAGVVFR